MRLITPFAFVFLLLFSGSASADVCRSLFWDDGFPRGQLEARLDRARPKHLNAQKYTELADVKKAVEVQNSSLQGLYTGIHSTCESVMQAAVDMKLADRAIDYTTDGDLMPESQCGYAKDALKSYESVQTRMQKLKAEVVSRHARLQKELKDSRESNLKLIQGLKAQALTKSALRNEAEIIWVGRGRQKAILPELLSQHEAVVADVGRQEQEAHRMLEFTKPVVGRLCK